MAHEISLVNGVAEAAFAIQPAWHGLGELVNNLMTPQQALDKAHLRWTVEKRPIYIKAAGGEFKAVPDKVATFRTDLNQYLGTVGSDWVPVQNEEQANFIAALVGNGAVVECVGALRQGKRTFWTVKAPGDVVIGGQDVVSKYLVVCNGHDGSLAFRAFWSPTRVVCANTLRAALGGVQDSVALFHRSKVSDHLADARRTLGLADSYYTKLAAEFTKMLDRALADAEFKLYVDEVIPATAKDGGTTKMEQVARETITRNYFETGLGREMAGRTAWGAYNAVAEFLSHHKEYSSGERKFEQLVIGGNGVGETQQRAFGLAATLAKA